MAIDCRCGKEQRMKFCVPAAVSSAMASEASKNGQRWTKKTIGNFGEGFVGGKVCGRILWTGTLCAKVLPQSWHWDFSDFPHHPNAFIPLNFGNLYLVYNHTSETCHFNIKSVAFIC